MFDDKDRRQPDTQPQQPSPEIEKAAPQAPPEPDERKLEKSGNTWPSEDD